MLAIIDEIGKTKMSHKMNNQAPEQGLNEDRMLTTLRNNGSNKGHSLCKLSTFRASITTLEKLKRGFFCSGKPPSLFPSWG
jgi:hypothetical protein